MTHANLFADSNPLINTLGPILDHQQLAKRVERHNDLWKEVRKMPDHVRAAYADACFDQVVVPSLTYQAVYSAMVSAMIRHYGAVDWKDPRMLGRTYGIDPCPPCTVDRNLVKTAASIVVVGPSGTGKTTMLNAIANLWPDYQRHTQLISSQVVLQVPVLYLQLTSKIRGRSLYLQIIEALERRVGGHDLIRQANYRGLREAELKSTAQRLCVQFNVGVIIVDEAQRLAGKASTADDSAINEMLYLRDGLGIPLVFCGTFRIVELLEHDERLYRRALENGVFSVLFADSHTERHWTLVCNAYWQCMVLRKLKPLDEDMYRVLFDVSAGMPWALKEVLQHAQKQALTARRETLTADDLRRVYQNELVGIHPLVNAMRSGNRTALQKYEHMYHPLFDRREQRKAAREEASLQTVFDYAADAQPLAA